ncbi:EAL domain-containing protein [Aeromonas salmonicida]|uniref:EAL domain-containing protein n=1 Tax=Aeromonas salmonicida TaxID=645 RepID=UPI00279650F2|nr:EAL domain-containing protein [Aeromonas salmonicida]MDQ1886573.1 EAL domain-containing protein [Aeromonas salmonicida]
MIVFRKKLGIERRRFATAACLFIFAVSVLLALLLLAGAKLYIHTVSYQQIENTLHKIEQALDISLLYGEPVPGSEVCQYVHGLSLLSNITHGLLNVNYMRGDHIVCSTYDRHVRRIMTPQAEDRRVSLDKVARTSSLHMEYDQPAQRTMIVKRDGSPEHTIVYLFDADLLLSDFFALPASWGPQFKVGQQVMLLNGEVQPYQPIPGTQSLVSDLFDVALIVQQPTLTALFYDNGCWAWVMAMYGVVLGVTFCGFERHYWRRVMRTAMVQGEITAYIQPVVNHQGRWVGGEALVRWHTATGQIAAPDIIDMAKKCSLYHELTLHIARQALSAIMAVRDYLPSSFYLSLNVEWRDLESEWLYLFCASEMIEYKSEGVVLCLEISEQTQCHQSINIQEVLTLFSDTGCLLALDDFGTGYSSFTLLERFSGNIIKIDKSLLRTHAELIESVIRYCQLSHTCCILEGIESVAQYERFSEENNGVYFQGYYFSTPLCCQDFIKAAESFSLREQSK